MLKFETKCVHADGNREDVDNTGCISFPIYQSSTFKHDGFGKSTGYDYSRLQNPTKSEVERVINSLEKGYDTLAFSTGMAAISATFELFEPNSHIIASDDLYGGAIRLFDNISNKNGISVTYYDTSVLDGLEGIIRSNTKAIYIETPSNPLMRVTDIAGISKIAKKHNLLLVIDNTFLSPYFQQPISLGADIVIHSGTKFLSGHNDTLAGFVVLNSKELSEKLRFIIKTVGSGLSPFDSWLVIRGVKTLAIRMERQQENAIIIANWLKNHDKIEEVYYIGLKDNPYHELSLKQSSGFGSMISFRTKDKETAINILNNIKIISFAESLGGVESLITYPFYQTHADVKLEERLARGIDECLLRLSVGIENIDDLIGDLNTALR